MFKTPIILKDKYITSLFIASFVFLVIGFSIAYVGILDNNGLLVIHFDSFRGADFFGTNSDILDILISAAIVWFINVFLAYQFYYRERFLTYVIAFSTLVFMILILVAINVIISVN